MPRALYAARASCRRQHRKRSGH